MYWNEDFGGVMTTDDRYGVQLIKTSDSPYPVFHVFAEGWVHTDECVCHNADIGGVCEIEDIPENILEAMKAFMMEYDGTTADKIKALREWKNMSQDKFAKFLDIPVGTIRNWEQGIAEPPKWAYKLMEFYVYKS